MITVDLQAEIAMSWDGPRFNWKCPLCDDGGNVADRCLTPAHAVELALYHLETRHDIDYDLVRISVEYWTLRINGPITLEKVVKRCQECDRPLDGAHRVVCSNYERSRNE